MGSIGEEKNGRSSIVVITKQKSVSTFSQTIFSFSCSTDFVPKAFSASIFLRSLSLRARSKQNLDVGVCDIFVDFLKTRVLFLYILTNF